MSFLHEVGHQVEGLNNHNRSEEAANNYANQVIAEIGCFWDLTPGPKVPQHQGHFAHMLEKCSSHESHPHCILKSRGRLASSHFAGHFSHELA